MLFFDEGDGRPRLALKHRSTGIDSNHLGNQDPLADLQPIRVPRNEANPAAEDGLPAGFYNVSKR
ncbi:hypothetical protein [Paludibaculum fermentans]|uniref:Uncharacterized protein n=1 Tax=Paludibaculum fermentans TaxID=1473598 RepID=A0A7S7SJ10_PALFE|nr:hypothetical protein [Paludibaculum fermentans]QOY87577.1 hypothetical protein IRI77_33290 [Paludibaculum fermentans]